MSLYFEAQKELDGKKYEPFHSAQQEASVSKDGKYYTYLGRFSYKTSGLERWLLPIKAIIIICCTLLFGLCFPQVLANLRGRKIAVVYVQKINLESNKLADNVKKVIDATPQFKGYAVTLPADHTCHGVVLTGTSKRPSNLFFEEYFKGMFPAPQPTPKPKSWWPKFLPGSKAQASAQPPPPPPINITTNPGSGELFRFLEPHDKIRKYINERAQNAPKEAISFTAKGKKGFVQKANSGPKIDVNDLGEIYGNNVYQISNQEVQEMVNSQKVYLSSLLPAKFYRDFKQALKEDKIIELPGNDATPMLLKELKGSTTHLKSAEFLKKVAAAPLDFGFKQAEYFKTLEELSLYQLGSMVVKREDYRVFVDGNGKIMSRAAEQNDAIRLINACGVRGIHSSKTPAKYNKAIMTENFKASLAAGEKGILVFPAVGMGVWRGDPNLYWRAFLDAVAVSAGNFEAILVNPGHQATTKGIYTGHNGSEFESILNEHLLIAERNAKNDKGQALENLKKVQNLFGSKQDLVQLAHNLKKNFPEKMISLFNASDPDVTLGYHVGEYVNNLPHTLTTEENYTAMGTNGLCFEGITGIHEDTSRVVEA